MRWEELFADLEGQAAAQERAELDAEVSDRMRRERARIRLVDRLRGMAAGTGDMEASVLGDETVRGPLIGVGADWLVIGGSRAETLVRVDAILGLRGGGPEAAEPGSEGVIAGRLGLGVALRAIARDRSEVRLLTVAGGIQIGTVDVVGADHLEITLHPRGEPRTRTARSLVPFTAVSTIRTERR